MRTDLLRVWMTASGREIEPGDRTVAVQFYNLIRKGETMSTRYFESFSSGQEFELGSRRVSREEIVSFASQYDPQAFHVDEEVANESFFGGLVASGWHTAAVCMRLLVDGLLSDTAVVGALGIEELQWRRPVRPGDELALEATVTGAEPWDDEKGLVELSLVATNGDGERVMSRTDRVLVRREADADGGADDGETDDGERDGRSR